MPSPQETYKGRKIVIPENLDAAKLELFIDDRPIKVTRLQHGTYTTDLFAFKEFGSLHQLARTLIDQMPEV